MQGLDKKMKIGKHSGKTPREIIDQGDWDYIDYMDNKGFYFQRDVDEYKDKLKELLKVKTK